MSASADTELAGKVVAVTGAARGIGRAIATSLAREGARVGLGDLDAELARRAAAKIGGETEGFELNVADVESFEAFLDAVEERFGPLGVLISNAGIMHVGPFVEEDPAAARRMVDVNLHGGIHAVKLALERMHRRGTGHIVVIASLTSNTGFPGAATYSATKHGLRGLSEAVRGELRRERSAIEISCVMPGGVKTEMTTGLVKAPGMESIEPEQVAEAVVDVIRRPRFDVHVPRSLGPIGTVMRLLPRPAREAVFRAMRGDRLLYDADRAARREYEARAAASDPPPARATEPAPLADRR